MSATAFKNAVRRREHYERHQPKAREHLGLLEKHKDYTQRAKAFHDKEKRITKLKQKAANRNPDEFYFKMLNTRTKGGVHQAESERPLLTGDMLKVMKTQDRTYIQTMKNEEDRKIERLRASLHDVGTEKSNKHVKFDSGDGAVAGSDLDDDGIMRFHPHDNSSSAQLAGAKRQRDEIADDGKQVSKVELKTVRKQRKTIEKEKKKAYIELQQRQSRSDKLGKLTQHVDIKRALLQKGKRIKVADASGDKPAMFMWKPQRKK